MSTKHHHRCPSCGSLQTCRWGTRKIGKRRVQRFRCTECGQNFTLKLFRRISKERPHQ